MATKGNVTKPSKQQEVLSLLAPMAAIVLAFLVVPHFAPNVTPAASKPFSTFEEFYPFYISQHSDPTCRRLHIVGTSIIIFYSLFDPFTFPSMILAAMAGSVMFPLTRGMEMGLVEGFCMLYTFFYFMRRFTGDWKRGLFVPLVAYSFAWAGHYFFEHNKPATFIYPMFSLFGDFRMCFETYALQRQW